MKAKKGIFRDGKVKLMGIGLAALLVMGSPVSTFADVDENLQKTNDLDITIKSGSIGTEGLNLEIPNINSAGEVKIEDEAKTHTTSFDGDFEVSDLRGTHSGWQLNVAAAPLSISDIELPKGSLLLKQPSEVEGNGVVPKNIVQKTQVIDNGQVNIIDAYSDEGAGVFDISFAEDALEIVVDPATARAERYETTLYWSLSSTPNPN